MKRITQAEFMRRFNESHREDFEPRLFERNNEDLVEAIRKVLKSCERDRYFTLKVLDFEAIYDYEEIYNTLRAHQEKRRRKNNKDENIYDFINIKDTDMILVKINWLVRHNGTERMEQDGKTVEVKNPQEVLEVLIALPRFVKKYYFRLSGNYYTTTFQIVDGSTYNNSTARNAKVDVVTMKTLFPPIRIFRCYCDIIEYNTKEKMRVIEYNANVFSNTVNAMFYLLANFGLHNLYQFLGIDCIYVTNQPSTTPGMLCFRKFDLYISCPEVAFQDSVVQALCAALYNGILKFTTLNDVFDIKYWLKLLGSAFKNTSIDKGLFVLDSIDGIYDDITKEDLHMKDEDKENIYTIIRWLLREFSQLRAKENVDVRTKRIRIADYIAAIYANRLNKSMYRISDMGARVTLKKIVQAVYTRPLYIIDELSNQSNLVSYRDMVNDNDAMVALKYTYKGISGLGENGASVQPVYRFVDPSHVGILDLDASSNSDPGMSGMICPMTKLYGKSFSDYQEPDTWRENFAQIKEQYQAGKIQPLEFTRPEEPVDCYAARNKVIDEELHINKVICPIENIKDPSISYTSVKTPTVSSTYDSRARSLFNIIPDDEESDYSLSYMEIDDEEQCLV